MPDIHSSHKLIIVTGKGGVGKTLLAAALARLSADSGLNTVLVTLDTRDDRHPLLDVPLEYTPYQVAPRLAASRVDAFEAVSEYARKTMPFTHALHYIYHLAVHQAEITGIVAVGAV